MLKQGSTFDNRYELIRLLGRGGFAEVWLVNDTLAGLEEALKIYAPGSGMDEDGLKVFAKELSVVHNLRHTNLLTPKTLGQCDNQPYLVLPYCPNGSLNKKVGNCTEEEAWKIIGQVASGLAYLHQRNIIHQDIKPDNILTDENNDYVITDFGISMKAQSTLRKSMRVQANSGTMAYMAPERFSTEPHPIPANDVWSLGAMVFELLEGEVPFFAQMGGLAQKNGADLPTMHADVSDALKQLVLSMLAKEAEARPTAEQVAELAKKRQGGATPSAAPKPKPIIEQKSQPVDDRKTQRIDDRKTQRIEPAAITSEKKELLKEKKPINTSNPKRKKRIIGWNIALTVILLVEGLIFGLRPLKSESVAMEERVLIDGLYYNLYADNTAKVVYELWDNENNYIDIRGELRIPSSVQYKSTSYAVTSIGDAAFRSCTNLTSVTIPNSVTGIGDEAFSMSGITEPTYNQHIFAYMPRSYSGAYTIPDGIEHIAGGAFSNCTDMTSITIPNSVTSIGKYAFLRCNSLKSITIPSSVTSIGNSAFAICHRLNLVTIPSSVTSIGNGVFDGCINLTSVNIPNSVTSIGIAAFRDCGGLTSVTIPNSVTNIGDNAFMLCTSLTSVKIPNSVTSIGDNAFMLCTSLTSVKIPKHTHIGSDAFDGCDNVHINYY